MDIGVNFHIVPIPFEIADIFLTDKIRRVLVTFNGHTVRRAIQTRTNGEAPYIVMSRDLMRTVGVQYGETVFVDLEADPEPNRIDIPEELMIALEQDEPASTRFYGMTPGKQRGLAHYVSSAKRPETRIKRALELAHKLRTYTLYSDKKRD